MITYLGREFKNHEELMIWNKKGNIEHYKKLVANFNNTFSLEASEKIAEMEEILVNHFGMTHEELEEIELNILEAVA